MMNSPINFKDFQELLEFCELVAESKMFPHVPTKAAALMIVTYGFGLGLDPVQALLNVKNVRGTLTPSAALVGALIKRSKKYDYRVVTHTNTECVLEFFENGVSVGQSTFTQADAVKSGTAANSNYNKFQRNFLIARATTNGARWYCPDVFSGAVYTEDELQDGMDFSEEESVTSTLSSAGKPVKNFVQRGVVAAAAETAEHQEVSLEAYKSRLYQVYSEYKQLLTANNESPTITIPDGELSKTDMSLLGGQINGEITRLKKKLAETT